MSFPSNKEDKKEEREGGCEPGVDLVVFGARKEEITIGVVDDLGEGSLVT